MRKPRLSPRPSTFIARHATWRPTCNWDSHLSGMRGGLDYGFRQAITQGLIKGPRLFLSVSMLTQTGGHGDKRGIARHENVPRNSIGIYPEICDGPDAVRKSAREMLRRGADQIKVMADGGVASPTDRPGHWQYTVEELKAAVATAEAAGTYSFVLLLHSPRCLQRGFALNSLDSAWIDVIEISYIEI